MDLHLFNEGSHAKLYEKLGAHPVVRDGRVGTVFRVWAPNAAHVSVVGDFNGWQPGAHGMHGIGSSGIWEAFIPDARRGARYKYLV